MKRMKLESLPPEEQARFRRMLEKEFTAFLNTALNSRDRGWPEITIQTVADALADSLITLGTANGVDDSALRVLILELQDRLPEPIEK